MDSCSFVDFFVQITQNEACEHRTKLVKVFSDLKGCF